MLYDHKEASKPRTWQLKKGQWVVIKKEGRRYAKVRTLWIWRASGRNGLKKHFAGHHQIP